MQIACAPILLIFLYFRILVAEKSAFLNYTFFSYLAHRRKRKMILWVFVILFLIFSALSAQGETLPRVEREFRAVWMATVDNIDFPSRKNLSIKEQRAEILKNLELVKSLKMNVIIFQVRPMCDALYQSNIEPWSEFLTGQMGKPQAFDPLKFITDEAHKRGILVHAWFNPYRAYHPAAKTVSENHISKRRPDLVRKYGNFLWLDPTDEEVKQYSLSVILDVVRRYDIDGVHFDDYFFPYPITENGKKVDFPDDKNWEKYKSAGGGLSRDDWRRKNVDDFIEAVGREIKKIKPDIMYGISPFGVAEENYKNLYADAEKWLREGWIDYFVPQLYWKIDRPNREFPLLLKFWESKNAKKRHVWAGIGTYKLYNLNENYSPAEIVNQILLTRQIQSTAGNVQFSFKSIRDNRNDWQAVLREKVYQREAIIPRSLWIRTSRMQAPRLTISKNGKSWHVKFTERGTKRAFLFVLYAKVKGRWQIFVYPATKNQLFIRDGRQIEKIIVKSVDRLGNESP